MIYKLKKIQVLFFLFSFIYFGSGCDNDNGGESPVTSFQLNTIRVGTTTLVLHESIEVAGLDAPVVCSFSVPLDTTTVRNNIEIRKEFDNNEVLEVDIFYLDNEKTVSLRPKEPYIANKQYVVTISNELKGKNKETFPGIDYSFRTKQLPLELEFIEIDGQDMLTSNRVTDISGEFEIRGRFSHDIDPVLLKEKTRIFSGSDFLDFNVSNGSTDKEFVLTPTTPLTHLNRYSFQILSSFESIEKNKFQGFLKPFYTALDTTDKFPRIPDEELLTLVQEQTFKYFWEFGHPVSGLARERNKSGNTVTSGGSGFGLMAMIVAIERGFITREEGLARFETIVDFLGTKADRFHGVWPHWFNGNTGEVIPFSTYDNGGDLVETAFLTMGLLTVRQYLQPAIDREKDIIDAINTLWEGIEWDWHTKGGQNELYWHWSPNYDWQMNLPVRGYNETLITHILAASSPTHAVDSQVYHQGWARNDNMPGGHSIYGYVLPLGRNKGGPLFFEHYTYLGLDPRGLTDRYADYWQQCVNHTLINREHCIQNPFNYVGYSESCWGLTASDNDMGYSAHSPSNDRGVITPTAALSSMAYTPHESMEALHHFYYKLGDKLWGEYGFYDAFNPTAGWVASSYIAIDQGPIVGMIENHRTALLWDLFMSCPEIQDGLNKLEFNY